MGRPRRAPADAVRNVFCRKWFGDTPVHRRGLLGVPSVSVQAELFRAHHAGGNLGHPHRLTVQFEAQGFGQRSRAVFRGRVAAAALVDNPACGRADDNHVTGSAPIAPPATLTSSEHEATAAASAVTDAASVTSRTTARPPISAATSAI